MLYAGSVLSLSGTNYLPQCVPIAAIFDYEIHLLENDRKNVS
jgi:hypothetical protein